MLGNLHLCVSGPYEIPHLAVDSFAVLTHAVPGGAFRGFGAPQGAFVAETQMNKLAERLGLDPVELRRRNLLHDGSLGPTGTEMPPGVSLPVVVDRCADAAHWTEPLPPAEAPSPFASLPPQADALRRGRGFACGFKNVGFSFGFPERCEARLVLHGDDEVDHVELFHAGAEVGQGSHTAFLQMAAEAVGVPVERVEATFSDTASAGDAGSASASRLTFMSGNAILGAAEEAEKRWRAGDRPAVGHFRYVPPPTEPLDAVDSLVTPNFAYTYGAQAVALTVDIGTGHIVVDEVVCAVDAGRAINPDLVAGQIEGGVVQAHGYAITEDLQVRDARILNPRLSTYLMPGILDIPRKVRSVIVEEPDPRGPWGARGVAEVPMIPYAPAVVAALHDATGVWFDCLPAHAGPGGGRPPRPRHRRRTRPGLSNGRPLPTCSRWAAGETGCAAGPTGAPTWRGRSGPVASPLRAPGDFPGHEVRHEVRVRPPLRPIPNGVGGGDQPAQPIAPLAGSGWQHGVVCRETAPGRRPEGSPSSSSNQKRRRRLGLRPDTEGSPWRPRPSWVKR